MPSVIFADDSDKAFVRYLMAKKMIEEKEKKAEISPMAKGDDLNQ